MGACRIWADASATDRADERRSLFEEAAGVGLYRDRRHSTARRLEETANDLQRLEDLIEADPAAEPPLYAAAAEFLADLHRHSAPDGLVAQTRAIEAVAVALDLKIAVKGSTSLDDPASVTDPTGFNSSADTIIGHVLQVVHANPDYDLQLLASFPGGLQAMEDQVVQILAGTHPRGSSILATVEDATYHERLLAHVRAFRARPADAAPLLRDNVAGNPRFAQLERTFGELTGAMRYFSKLPRDLAGAVRHLVRVREFPAELAAG